MSVGPQLLAKRPARQRLPPPIADRRVSRLQAEVRRERVLSVCLVIVALHLAAVAVLFPGGANAFARVAMLLIAVFGPPLLLVWLTAASRGARVLVIGVIGLGATAAGLATSVPHAVLTDASGSDFTGILATAAGIVLVAIAFREALRGRRTVIKLVVGAPAICRHASAQRGSISRTMARRGVKIQRSRLTNGLPYGPHRT
jgi:hypothetical protein